MTWSNVRIALVTTLVSAGVAIAITSWWVPRAEQHARNTVIERVYQSQLASCRRGKGLRLEVRANAIAESKAYKVLGGFLTGARPRAFAQSKDPNISAESRNAARESLKSIDHGIRVLATHIAIPQKPLPCDEVITDPTAPALPHHR
jgi:lipopolysaccharide export LptBFGC system permease protein LptF